MNESAFLTAPTEKIRRFFRSRKPSGRKLRLFMVACCRMQRAHIVDENCLALIDLAEQVADGGATDSELARAREVMHRWCRAQGPVVGDASADERWIALWGAYQTATDKPTNPAYGFIKLPLYRPLLADIIGPPPNLAAFSRAWRTDTAIALARGVYDSRDFSAMPILADALQDAGCDNEHILNHCRSGGGHVRGCWVVDLVLGKE
jgi:hypothetical protein